MIVNIIIEHQGNYFNVLSSKERIILKLYKENSHRNLKYQNKGLMVVYL